MTVIQRKNSDGTISLTYTFKDFQEKEDWEVLVETILNSSRITREMEDEIRRIRDGGRP